MVKTGEKRMNQTRDDGLAIGTDLPRHELTVLAFQTDGITALFFVSLYCMHCVDLLPHLKKITSEYPISIILYCNGDEEDHAEMADYFGWDFPIISASQEEMKVVFQVTTLPFVLLCDESNRIIAKSVVYNDDGFDFLLQTRGEKHG